MAVRGLTARVAIGSALGTGFRPREGGVGGTGNFFEGCFTRCFGGRGRGLDCLRPAAASEDIEKAD